MAEVELSAADRKAHEADEAIIARGLASFIEAGRALMRIRDRRSYVLTHESFGAYCRERWRFNAAQAYRLIGSAEVIDVLEGQGVEILPASTNVAYALKGLAGDPPRLVQAWRSALDESPRPIAREVTRMLRDGDQPEREAEAFDLSGDQERFVRAIAEATTRVESAKSLMRSALSDVEPELAQAWARRLKRLRTLATDVQRAVDRKT